MIKKLFFIICVSLSIISFANIGFASNHLDNYFSYSPDGRQNFKLSEEQVLIKFLSTVSFEQQASLLKTEPLLMPLTKDMLLPAPKVTVAKTNGNIGEEKLTALLKRLEQSNLVEYANPFLIYKDGTKQGITDRFMVKLRDALDVPVLNQMVSNNGLEIVENYKYDNKVYIVKVPKTTGKNALQMANLFYESGKFAASEPDFLLLLKPFSTNDTFLDYQWSLNNTGSALQYNGTSGCDMNVFNAWTISTGSSAIKVAILDEGVDLVHPDLQANILPGFDATGLGSGGAPSNNDAHGTACAGIVAGVANNGLGVAGIAYGCKIIPVRIAYKGTDGSWVSTSESIGTAIDWAWQTGGADILSNSWGGGSNSSFINDAVDRAVTQGRGGLGSPVLFSAGNDNSLVAYPATLTNVISVTAMSMCNTRKSKTSCDGETWWGSNYGTNADISAPGVKIYTTDISGAAGYNTGDYAPTFNGTSSACPNAAGVMALILSVNPNLTVAQARQVIESTCDKVGGYTYNPSVAGQPNGTWSNDLGYGKVNAFAALQLATPIVCTSPPPVFTALATPNSFCTTAIVTLSLNGVPLVSNHTYQWQSSPDNSTWTTISSATLSIYSATVSASTYFRCVVTCSGISTNSTSVLVPLFNSIISTYPHLENFDASNTIPCGWLVQNVNADGKTWNASTLSPHSGTNNMTYSYNSALAADDWLFTPSLSMEAGSTYRVKFWYRARSVTYPEKLEVKWGSGQTAASMTSNAIFSNTNINTETYTEGVSTIIAPANTGNYNIGFRVFSAADMYDLYIDDVTIELVIGGCPTPTVGGTATVISPIVSGSNTTFNLVGYNGTNIEWEQSTDAGSSWTAVSGATTATYSGTYYLGTYKIRAKVSRDGCPDDFSNEVTLTVNPLVGDNFNLPIVVNSLPYSTANNNSPTSGYTNQFTSHNSADVYYKITTGNCTDSVLVSTCGSSFDTYLHILDAAGTELNSNDDNGPSCSGSSGSIRISVTPNTVYYAVVEGYSSYAGNFNLNISETGNSGVAPIITYNGVTTFCEGDFVVLTSSSATGNTWNTGATSQSITVNITGSYSVTVNNGSGCSGTSAPVIVTVLPQVIATISPNGTQTICEGSSVVLTASSGAAYNWSTGETTQSITVTTAGNYSVSVINGSGCVGTSAPVTVTVVPQITPTISPNGTQTICDGSNVVLTASSGAAYNWSTGETTQSITVTTAGNYSVSVINGSGCVGTSAPVTVTVVPQITPTISPNGTQTICEGSSVVLTASSGTVYNWSTGETTQSITVTTAGDYSVSVINGSGCVGTSAPVEVTVIPEVIATITANGSTTFCEGDFVVLTSSSPSGNTWNTGATSQSITVNVTGSYSVTVNNGSGCVAASAPVIVTVIPLSIATISPSGSILFCEGGSQVLTASSGAAYNWSTGATTQSITVTTAGSYTVSVINASGCVSISAPVSVTVVPQVTANITANGPLTFCEGGSVILTSSSPTGNTWNTGETAQSITVTLNGVYSVTVNNGVGCVATSDPVQVTVVPQATANITANGPLTFCEGGSVVLTASSGAAYNWSTGETTQSITVTTAGDYTVSVINGGGCMATSAPITVNVFQTPTVTIAASGLTDLCPGESVTLTSSQPTGNVWNTGSSASSITVSNAGVYSVVYTNANLCVASATIAVTSNPTCAPTTQLRASDCGKLDLAKNASILCDPIAGATQYEFEITNMTNNVVALKVNNTNYVVFNSINPAMEYGTQYHVRVRAKVGGVYGEFGSICTIGIVCDPAVCGVPNTTLRSSDCGKINQSPTVGQVIANAVAAATAYEFEFTDLATNTVYSTMYQSSNVIALNAVVPSLQWGATYSIRVRAYVASMVGNYGDACLISFLPNPALTGVPTTTLRGSDCGKVNFGLSSFLVANSVATANQYEFEFRNVSTNAVVATYAQANNILAFTSVPQLQWGTQYNVAVRARIAAVWGNFGASCIIGFICNPSVCGVQQTNLRASDCGKLNFNFSSGFVAAESVPGATLYEFEITNLNTNSIVSVQSRASTSLFFNSIVPAIQNNVSYSIRVRATISGVTGLYGNACVIGFASGSRESAPQIDEATFELAGAVLDVYPNPFVNALSITINTEQNQELNIELHDLSGKLIMMDKYSAMKGQSVKTLELNEMANGFYILKITNADGRLLKVSKLIRQY